MSSVLHRAYRFVNRPYYWYRPAQIRTRLRGVEPHGEELHLVRTAWGSHLYCWHDSVGSALERTGVYDLAAAETLARLADPGETAIDAGANVGVMSDVLAYAVGSSGRVISFEPHPVIFQTLARNVTQWAELEGIDTVEARQEAVSSTRGTLPLSIDPHTFDKNKGTASLESRDGNGATNVKTVRLDDELTDFVGVLKLDVEGHELAALEGAAGLLQQGLIRDIVFEEHERPPTPVTSLLEANGYSVLSVRQGLAGPILCQPDDAFSHKLWDPPALLATADPDRARRCLRRKGWLTLRKRLGRPRTS